MKMPPAAPGSLGAAIYAQIAAYILQSDGIAPSLRDMPTDAASLATARPRRSRAPRSAGRRINSRRGVAELTTAQHAAQSNDIGDRSDAGESAGGRVAHMAAHAR